MSFKEKYEWKFRLTLPKNQSWNTSRTRRLWRIKVGYDLLIQLESYKNTVHFDISSVRKAGNKIPESSRLEFFKKFSGNNFSLSDVEVNTSRSLNRGGQHIKVTEWWRCSRFTFFEKTISHSPEVTWFKFLEKDRLYFFYQQKQV